MVGICFISLVFSEFLQHTFPYLPKSITAPPPPRAIAYQHETQHLKKLLTLTFKLFNACLSFTL